MIVTEDGKTNQGRTDASAAPRSEAEERKARLAAQLRANLRRRKDQARGQKAQGESDD